MSGVVEKTLELAAGPERVWRALTDPAELSSWFPERTELPGREGGTGWFEWARHGRFAVRVEAAERPRRLVWTWARDPDVALEAGPRTTVEWTLERREDGGTTLRLRESGFSAPDHRARNDTGWDEELVELEAHLE